MLFDSRNASGKPQLETSGCVFCMTPNFNFPRFISVVSVLRPCWEGGAAVKEQIPCLWDRIYRPHIASQLPRPVVPAGPCPWTSVERPPPSLHPTSFGQLPLAFTSPSHPTAGNLTYTVPLSLHQPRLSDSFTTTTLHCSDSITAAIIYWIVLVA